MTPFLPADPVSKRDSARAEKTTCSVPSDVVLTEAVLATRATSVFT